MSVPTEDISMDSHEIHLTFKKLIFFETLTKNVVLYYGYFKKNELNLFLLYVSKINQLKQDEISTASKLTLYGRRR